MLHNFAAELAPSITSLFNLFLKTGKLSDEWKLANVVPIPKNSHIQDVPRIHDYNCNHIINFLTLPCAKQASKPHLNGIAFVTNANLVGM